MPTIAIASIPSLTHLELNVYGTLRRQDSNPGLLAVSALSSDKNLSARSSLGFVLALSEARP